mgnify:CR=1 FL=1
MGVVDVYLIACYVPEGYAETPNDCDDTNELLTPFDTDSDGYSSCQGDCVDNIQLGSSIYLGAPELCDGLDNDCDELVDDNDDDIDEESATLVYPDEDNDTFGNSDLPTFFCNVPNGYVEIGGDCLDDVANGPFVYPDATEVCDGFDNNCNEEIDEDAGGKEDTGNIEGKINESKMEDGDNEKEDVVEKEEEEEGKEAEDAVEKEEEEKGKKGDENGKDDEEEAKVGDAANVEKDKDGGNASEEKKEEGEGRGGSGTAPQSQTSVQKNGCSSVRFFWGGLKYSSIAL